MSTKVGKIILPIIILALLAFCTWYFKLYSLLSVDSFIAFEESHGFWSVLIFIVLFAVTIVFLLPESILSVLAGIFFGTWLGFLYSMLGVLLGAITAFYITRHYGRGFVERLTHKKFDKVKVYEAQVSKNGFVTVLLIRLTPLLPFKVPNYIFGLTKIRFRDYFLATLIGMIPETFILVYFGDSLSTLSYSKMLIAAAISIIFIGLSFYYRNKIFKP